jgi:anti-sigma regulatory factor (Ser/Thr protein kinase)
MEADHQMRDARPPAMTIRNAHGLSAARHFIAAAAVSAGLDHARARKLELAASEALTNALKYAGGLADIYLSHDAGAFTVCLSDRGKGFDRVSTAESPDPGSPGGRGLWMIQQLCDRVDIRSTAEGTTIILTMIIQPAPTL